MKIEREREKERGRQERVEELLEHGRGVRTEDRR